MAIADENGKGHIEMVLLAALQRGPAHGYALIERIRLLSDSVFTLPEGTVYPLLHRLEQKGQVRSHWEQPPEGRKRRVYTLMPAGEKALVARHQLWRRFSGAVRILLQEK